MKRVLLMLSLCGIFCLQAKAQATQNTTMDSTLYRQGMTDAYNNFKCGGVKAGGFFCGFGLGYIGLIVMPAFSHPPKEYNMITPHPDLLKEPSYKLGYSDYAIDMKKQESKKWCWGGIAAILTYTALRVALNSVK